MFISNVLYSAAELTVGSLINDSPSNIFRRQDAVSPRHSHKTGDRTPSLLPPPPPPGSNGRLSRGHRSVAEEGLGAESTKHVPHSPRRRVLEVLLSRLVFFSLLFVCFFVVFVLGVFTLRVVKQTCQPLRFCRIIFTLKQIIYGFTVWK